MIHLIQVVPTDTSAHNSDINH